MLRKDGKIELLKKVPLFSQCNKKQLAAIASLADLIDLPEGTILIREGAPGRECMVIVEGAVEVKRKGRKINSLGPGDFIGEMALISGAPRIVTERQFWELLERTPKMQTSVIKALGERLQSLAV
jgi:CRP-like cAMP-binding protein